MRTRHGPCVGCTPNCFKKNCYGGMKSVKLNSKNTKGALNNRNALGLVEDLNRDDFIGLYTPLLKVIAELCDSVADGRDMFATLGANRQRTSFLLTISFNGDKTVVAGQSLLELADECRTLLDDVEAS